MIRWLFRLFPLRWRLLLLCHSALACRLLGQKMPERLRVRRWWEPFYQIGKGEHVKLPHTRTEVCIGDGCCNRVKVIGRGLSARRVSAYCSTCMRDHALRQPG